MYMAMAIDLLRMGRGFDYLGHVTITRRSLARLACSFSTPSPSEDHRVPYTHRLILQNLFMTLNDRQAPSRPRSFAKGKNKATESNFNDLNPIITYRHLLSRNLGVRDPLRVVALCDSDAFYAACEMIRLGVPNETPLVVLQWDSLIAVNYPARKYGISRMCKLKDALEKCPELKVVHVATYKEGEDEPGYWEDIDNHTHKVCISRTSHN